MRSILLVRTRRVSNEIHRIGLENLLDGCRVARAQYQRICNDIGCDTQHVENFILRELGVRFTQVISEEIVFRYLVAITSELFAFADVGIANIPTTDHEVQRGVHMARMFLLYHVSWRKFLLFKWSAELQSTVGTCFASLVDERGSKAPGALDIPYYLDVALQVERPPITPCKKAAGSLVY
ncbi:hypothetical protein BC832DRAFT_564578 [Gaertneriomyces semiglobifer]|nr:hypothetical protein BC832DRAFT_564578 [Gaertneriomyces semiglobifer]